MKSKIGVVIATYNGEKYIKEQLESIINQTVLPDYILISDGGSSDNTINICRNILSKTEINYEILEANRQLGVKDNFEKCLENCDTEYIFFSDQDDYWLSDKIKNMMEIFYKENAVVVFSNAYITNRDLKIEKKNLWKKIGYKTNRKINIYNKQNLKLQKELIKHNVMTGMCMAIDSKIKKEVLPISNYSIHDVWIAHVSNCLGKVVSLNSNDVLYRQHNNNVIGTERTIKNSLKRKNKYFNNLKNRYSFIEELLLRFEMDSKFYDNYLKYQNYIKKRIMFIEKKISFYYIILLIKKYYKYEYKFLQIMFKDIFTRMNFMKGNDYNENNN